MSYYNMSALENVTNMGDFAYEANLLSGGMMFQAFLIIIGMVILISLMSKDYPTSDAMIVTGFVTTLAAVLFWGGGFIQLWTVGLPLLIMLGGVGAKYFKSRG